MSLQYHRFLHFLLFISFLCCTNAEQIQPSNAGNGGLSSRETGPGATAWARLLEAFERHTEESKVLISNMANSEAFSLEKQLAILLLREWDLSANSKVLKTPEIVHIEYAKPEKNCSYQGGMHLAKIEVDSMGKLVKADIIKPTNPHTKDFVMKSLSNSCFRPPFVNGHFVPGSGVIAFHLDVKR